MFFKKLSQFRVKLEKLQVYDFWIKVILLHPFFFSILLSSKMTNTDLDFYYLSLSLSDLGDW